MLRQHTAAMQQFAHSLADSSLQAGTFLLVKCQQKAERAAKVG